MPARESVDHLLAMGVVQPDETTCGSCVLVVARLLNRPSYARRVVTGASPEAGNQTAETIRDWFGQQALEVQRVTSGLKGRDGGWQGPGPRHWAPHHGHWLAR